MISERYAKLSLQERALKIIALLRQATQTMIQPAATQIVAQYGRDPYLVLISCILSLRTRDTVSLPASQRLFSLATTPEAMLEVPAAIIAQTIYPTGFYKAKSRTIHTISKDLLERFNGQVPNNEVDLISLKGVGRKTANLVLGEGFGIPAICVDTHVHRISNRLGLVNTTSTDDTEQALKEILPPEYWVEYNKLLVMWGQNICVPISPLCSGCAIYDLCPQKGVTRRR